jgi:universal stress protein A
MTGLRTILIAIDASDEAEEVLEAAASIDPRCGLDYRVITVVPPMVGGVSGIDGMSFAAAWPLREMEESVVRQSAENIRERVAAYGIEPKSVSVRIGRPATEIRAHAERLHADLIVIGSHGRHGVKGVLLGSTANGVLHNSPCDVLTVRISTVSETAPS